VSIPSMMSMKMNEDALQPQKAQKGGHGIVHVYRPFHSIFVHRVHFVHHCPCPTSISFFPQQFEGMFFAGFDGNAFLENFVGIGIRQADLADVFFCEADFL